jgi:hypothetical protein
MTKRYEKDREEAKRLGLTMRAYRQHRTALADAKRREGLAAGKKPRKRYDKTKGFSGKKGDNWKALRELIDEVTFVQPLNSFTDTGNSYPLCRSCRKQNIFESYFCPTCGEHNDWLYGQEHVSGPRDMTREEILAEYEAADIPFEPKDYSPGRLLVNDLRMALGIDLDAYMPREANTEENKWSGLIGFKADRESSLST